MFEETIVVPHGKPRSERVAEIIGLLEQNRRQQYTTRQIATYLNISPSYANTLLRSMADAGQITRFRQSAAGSAIGYINVWGAK